MYRDSVRLDSKAADGWVDGGKHCGGFEHGGNEQLAPANDSDSARKISILFDARCIPSSSSSTATLSSYLTQTSPIFSADIGSVGGRQSLSVSHSLQLDRNWQDVRRNLKISDPTSRGARGEVGQVRVGPSRSLRTFASNVLIVMGSKRSVTWGRWLVNVVVRPQCREARCTARTLNEEPCGFKKPHGKSVVGRRT